MFVAFTSAYHGDTLGAASLGGIEAFQQKIRLARPVHPRRTCRWSSDAQNPSEIAAVVIEPLIQGAAGMRLWPRGMLADLRRWCDAHGVFLIVDEVMTGFGRTGTMFACEQEDVMPDFIALAKGLTGGYLPLAATLTTERIFSGFLGGPERTFYYGHSYTGNQLGCAAALANLAIFRDEKVIAQLQPRIARLTELLVQVRAMPQVFEVRQCGFIAGIELRTRPSAVPRKFADRREGLSRGAQARPAHAADSRYDRAHAAVLHHRCAANTRGECDRQSDRGSVPVGFAHLSFFARVGSTSRPQTSPQLSPPSNRLIFPPP